MASPSARSQRFSSTASRDSASRYSRLSAPCRRAREARGAVLENEPASIIGGGRRDHGEPPRPPARYCPGGIDLEISFSDPAAAQSTANSDFTLRASHAAPREQGLLRSGGTLRLCVLDAAVAGDLEENAAVTPLPGFQIGEVESTRLAYDERSGKPFTAVTALLYPWQLHVSVPAGAGDELRAGTDAEAAANCCTSATAPRLQQQTPALIGDRSIALVAGSEGQGC